MFLNLTLVALLVAGQHVGALRLWREARTKGDESAQTAAIIGIIVLFMVVGGIVSVLGLPGWLVSMWQVGHFILLWAF